MASLQNGRPTFNKHSHRLTNNLLSCKPVNNLDLAVPRFQFISHQSKKCRYRTLLVLLGERGGHEYFVLVAGYL